eukprot:TRINITY_DN7618_c0_g1_i3.p2 TRINITY_DN7618_c0_g1~~TRINITY_DN7618_c0_g1_i3.p2  ORF type:complete len:142 (-),score=26.11 TRINITY_DN7618_c0_g1_i3:170-595(-)
MDKERNAREYKKELEEIEKQLLDKEQKLKRYNDEHKAHIAKLEKELASLRARRDELLDLVNNRDRSKTGLIIALRDKLRDCKIHELRLEKLDKISAEEYHSIIKIYNNLRDIEHKVLSLLKINQSLYCNTKVLSSTVQECE